MARPLLGQVIGLPGLKMASAVVVWSAQNAKDQIDIFKSNFRMGLFIQCATTCGFANLSTPSVLFQAIWMGEPIQTGRVSFKPFFERTLHPSVLISLQVQFLAGEKR